MASVGHRRNGTKPLNRPDLPSVCVRSPQSQTGYIVRVMADFDVDAMIKRFGDRATVVKDRPLPPVAGAERQKFIEQAQTDYTDFALIAGSSWSVEDSKLVLRIQLGSQN